MDMEAYFQLVTMSNAFTLPFVLRAMVSLGVPDVLSKSAQPLTAKEIIFELKRHGFPAPVEDVISRLLNYLVVANVVKEGPADHFSSTKLFSWLVKDHPLSLAPYLSLLTSPEFQVSWQFLDKVALEGNGVTGFEKAHGVPLFQMASSHPEFNKLFNEGMKSMSSLSILSLIKNAGESFSGISRLVDVGGGNGLCISKLVQAFPNLQGVVYDLPHVISSASKAPVLGIEYVGGDMFESVPHGDGVFLKTVLHNWDDDKCKLVLKNCYDALPHKGKIIIMDMLVNPEKKKSSDVDLAMLAVVGGRERTEDEFKALLAPQGFSGITFKYLPPGSLGIIEASKK